MIIWERTPIGPGENLAQLKAHLELELSKLEDLIARISESLDDLDARVTALEP